MQAVLYNTNQKLVTSHYAPVYANKSLNFHFQPYVLDFILREEMYTGNVCALLKTYTQTHRSGLHILGK